MLERHIPYCEELHEHILDLSDELEEEENNKIKIDELQEEIEELEESLMDVYGELEGEGMGNAMVLQELEELKGKLDSLMKKDVKMEDGQGAFDCDRCE